MSTFLKLLPLELQDVKEFFEVSFEVKKDDNIVGTASDDLKRLYTLWQQKERMKDELKIKQQYEKISDREKYATEASQLGSKADAIRDLFWIGVNDEFNLWDKANVGIRKDYIVIYSDKKARTLGDLLGGMSP